MREYREVRARTTFLELCKTPSLAAEVTVTAAERLGVDAAIIFADILLILEPMGIDLEFAEGRARLFTIRCERVQTSIGCVKSRTSLRLHFVYEAIRANTSAL